MPIRIQKLCATLVLCLCLTGISSTAQNNPDSSLPALEVITVDNADRIEELAVYGGGLVEDAEWSADGSILAISGSVGIQLYDSSTTIYSPLGTLTGHNGDVSNVAWASNDMRLASTGEDSTVRIWDIQNQMEILVIDVPDSTRIRSIKWSYDTTMLAAVVYDDSCCVWITVWSAETGEELLRIDDANVGAISWSPLANYLAINSRVGVAIWDIVKQQSVLTLEGGFNPFWSPDGTYIATSIIPADDSAETLSRTAIQLWDSGTGEPLYIVEGHDEIQGLAWSPDGTQIASAGWYDGVRVSDVSANAEVRYFEGHEGVVADVAWSPDGQYLVSVGDSTNFDNTVRIWDIATGEPVYLFEPTSEEIYDMSFSPDGSEIVVTGPDGSRIVDIDSGQVRLQLSLFGTAVDWSSTESRIVSASGSDFPVVYDAESGDELQSMQESLPSYFWNRVVWSPDSSQIAGGGENGIVRVWNADGGQELVTMEHSGWMSAVNWSPDGTMLASGSGSSEGDNSVRIWDAMTGEEIAVFMGHQSSIDDVSWSPDGLQIATVSFDQTARILDGNTAEELWVLQGAFNGLDWSSDGNILVTGGADSAVMVWDTESGRLISTLRGHTDPFIDVGWSPTNTMIVSVSWDGTIRLWGVLSGE